MLPWASQAPPGPYPGQCEMNESHYSLKATLCVGNLSKATHRSLATQQREPPTTWTELVFGLRCSARWPQATSNFSEVTDPSL